MKDCRQFHCGGQWVTHGFTVINPATEEKIARLCAVAALVVVVSTMIGHQSAFAGVGVGIAPTYPAMITVGDTDVSVNVSIVNTSTPPESAGTLTLSLIRHTPSCGTDSPVPCPPESADPGVFLIIKGPVTGMAGSACANMTFTIGPADPTTGEVEFIPDAPVVLAPVGSGAMAGCTINFFVDVLKVPTIDASASPGIQTNQLGRVRGLASVNMVNGTGTGSGLTTVIAPSPTPTATRTNTPRATPTPTSKPTDTATPTPTATGCLGNGPGGLQDLIPGYCGPMYQDCLSEICLPSPGPVPPNGLPDNRLSCTNQDPTCDAVLGDNACTFTFRICFNLSNETRFQCSARGPVGTVFLHVPSENDPGRYTANRDAFEAAMMQLGGTIGTFKQRSISFVPPLANTVCTAPILWTVPLKSNQTRRTVRVNWFVYGSTRGYDGDHLYLRCNP